MTNVERVNAGLPEFKRYSPLNAAATTRAWELLVLFSHSRPNGNDFSTVLDEADIKWSSCGENIAAGQTTPEGVVDAWMNSPGHRANILNEGFEYLEVGFYFDKGNTASTNYKYYWSQNFCTLF